jgi:hypothetical protein
MDPGTAAIVIGTAVSAMGQIQAGINAQNAANRNAGVLFQNANAARLAANENAKRQARLGRKRAGANRALDPDKLDLLEDNAIEEELAVQSIVHAGEVEAIGFENRAQLQIMRGKSAKAAGVFGAFSTVLMGGGMAARGLTWPGATTSGSVGTAVQFNPYNYNVISGGSRTGSPLVLGA